jgi:hypothetical protein
MQAALFPTVLLPLVSQVLMSMLQKRVQLPCQQMYQVLLQVHFFLR